MSLCDNAKLKGFRGSCPFLHREWLLKKHTGQLCQFHFFIELHHKNAGRTWTKRCLLLAQSSNSHIWLSCRLLIDIDWSIWSNTFLLPSKNVFVVIKEYNLQLHFYYSTCRAEPFSLFIFLTKWRVVIFDWKLLMIIYLGSSASTFIPLIIEGYSNHHFILVVDPTATMSLLK